MKICAFLTVLVFSLLVCDRVVTAQDDATPTEAPVDTAADTPAVPGGEGAESSPPVTPDVLAGNETSIATQESTGADNSTVTVPAAGEGNVTLSENTTIPAQIVSPIDAVSESVTTLADVAVSATTPLPDEQAPPTNETTNATNVAPSAVVPVDVTSTTSVPASPTDADVKSRLADGDDKSGSAGASSGSSGGHTSKILIVLLLWTCSVVVLYLIVVNYKKFLNLWGYFCVCGVSPNSGPRNYNRSVYETYRSNDADL